MARAILLCLLLCFAGCDQHDPHPTRLVPKTARQPFSIGTPSQFAEHRVYEDFRRAYGVWIVSRDSSSGTMIVVLDAATPGFSSRAGTRYNSLTDRFECPASGARFTSDGLLAGTDGQANRSLERLRIELVRGELQIDPRRRFSHESNDWSNPLSMHILDSASHPDRDRPRPASPFAPNLTPTHGLIR
jgi:hypothetical protein